MSISRIVRDDSLEPGSRLGPYEIVELIGVGGMGEVYRARDTRLARDVAIKVLPESVSHEPDRLARFAREAKTVAALSHPNILAMYDVGEYQGLTYAVTELLVGETLRDRLPSGPVPVRKAVDIAVQIARGLAAAHDKGVVHRDLTPANVFLLTDGHVKILDFGLARQTLATVGTGTTETAATDAGTVLGTVGYMAPEQVRGQPVDGRADLFALGAVLYEMLTGLRAFHGTTPVDTMTAILREDPPAFLGVRGEAMPGLERVLHHCLEKNSAERFQNARDVAFALEAFAETSVGSTATTAATRPARRSRAGRLAVGAVVLGALGSGALIDRALHSRQPAFPSITYDAKTWDDQQYLGKARFGPDGQTIVFTARRYGEGPRIYVIRPGELMPRELMPQPTLRPSERG